MLVASRAIDARGCVKNSALCQDAGNGTGEERELRGGFGHGPSPRYLSRRGRGALDGYWVLRLLEGVLLSFLSAPPKNIAS